MNILIPFKLKKNHNKPKRKHGNGGCWAPTKRSISKVNRNILQWLKWSYPPEWLMIANNKHEILSTITLISLWKTFIYILGYATFVIGGAKDYAAYAPQGIIQIMEKQFFSQKWEESTQCQNIDLMYGCLTSGVHEVGLSWKDILSTKHMFLSNNSLVLWGFQVVIYYILDRHLSQPA